MSSISSAVRAQTYLAIATALVSTVPSTVRACVNLSRCVPPRILWLREEVHFNCFARVLQMDASQD